MIKKISYIVLIFICFSSLSSTAQLKWKYSVNKKSEDSKNSFYVEALGSAFQWSVNYERDFKSFIFRVGGSYATGDYLIPTVLSIPYRLPRKRLTIEYGIGLLHKMVAEKRDYAPTEVRPQYEIFPNLNFAARYQPNKRGFFIKLALTPFIDLKTDGESYFTGQEGGFLPVFIWGGASAGIAF